MTDLDLDALEAVAQAATPGEWRASTVGHFIGFDDPAGFFRLFEKRNWATDGDVAYVTTFSPPTMLALLGEVAALRQHVAEVQAERDDLANKVGEYAELIPEALRGRLDLHADDSCAICNHADFGQMDRMLDEAEARAEAAEQTVAAQARVIEQVRALHEPVDVWQYDDANGTWVLDEHGEKILLTRVCRACSGDEVLSAIEDCEYHEGWLPEEVVWPCDTWLVVDPNAWVDDLVRLAAAPTLPADVPVPDQPSGLTVHEVGKQVAAAYQSGLADARRNAVTPPAEADPINPPPCASCGRYDGFHVHGCPHRYLPTKAETSIFHQEHERAKARNADLPPGAGMVVAGTGFDIPPAEAEERTGLPAAVADLRRLNEIGNTRRDLISDVDWAWFCGHPLRNAHDHPIGWSAVLGPVADYLEQFTTPPTTDAQEA